MNKIKIFLTIFLIFTSSILISPIIIYNNNEHHEVSFNVVISRDFKNLEAKKSYFEFYFPEDYSFSNTEFNIQPFSTSISFNPEPDEKLFEYDKFKNKILKFSYENIYGFSVSLRFAGILKSRNNNILFIPFPYDEKDIPVENYIYLEFSPSSIVNDLAWQISKDKSNLISILFRIKQYIDSNILYTPIYQNRSIEEIIGQKRANREEILDLYIYILRAIGIPSRISCGLGLPTEYEYKSNNKNDAIKLYSGKGVLTYLEIWTKDYGWLFFDPFFSCFIPLNNYLKFGHAQYSNQLKYIYVQSQSSNISIYDNYKVSYLKNDKFIFDKINLNYLNYINILPENFIEFFQMSDIQQNKNIFSLVYPGFDDEIEKKLYFSGFNCETEIKIKEESILQPFYLNSDYIFSDLFINQIATSGIVNLKIYQGEQINDKNLIYQTRLDSSNLVNTNKKINIKLPMLNLKKGIYLLHIFLEQSDINSNILANNIVQLPGFFGMNLLQDGKIIKTNLIFPLVFVYQ